MPTAVYAGGMFQRWLRVAVIGAGLVVIIAGVRAVVALVAWLGG